ncbi:hypothetical protein FPV67DRAFT_1452961 [Lyophyllum atratum]|nr:hypothetical protein FPV67DRAFT_1452961 [Lyophyllum atratum]
MALLQLSFIIYFPKSTGKTFVNLFMVSIYQSWLDGLGYGSRQVKRHGVHGRKNISLNGQISFAEVQFYFNATIGGTQQTLALVSYGPRDEILLLGIEVLELPHVKGPMAGLQTPLVIMWSDSERSTTSRMWAGGCQNCVKVEDYLGASGVVYEEARCRRDVDQVMKQMYHDFVYLCLALHMIIQEWVSREGNTNNSMISRCDGFFSVIQ